MKDLFQKYSVPISIVIAGALIGGAVIYTNLNQKQGSPSGETSKIDLTEMAVKATGLKKSDIKKCVDSGKYEDRIKTDTADAQKSGLRGTPYAVLIIDNKPVNYIGGAYPLDEVKKLIDSDGKYVMPESDAKNKAFNNVNPITESDHIYGNKDARIKIVEFSDMQCPFCQRFHQTMKSLVSDPAYSGKIAWVYRHTPLDFHPYAKPAALTSECVNELGGNDNFWKFLDAAMTEIK